MKASAQWNTQMMQIQYMVTTLKMSLIITLLAKPPLNDVTLFTKEMQVGILKASSRWIMGIL